MKNSKYFIVCICIIVSFTFCSCLENFGQKSEKVFFVNTGEGNIAYNVSLSSMSWMTGQCGDEMPGIPVHEGDVLAIFKDFDERFSLVHRYDKKDGNDFSISFESINDQSYLCLLNNTVVQLSLSNEPHILGWLEKATEEDLKDIRTLDIKEDINSFPVNLLEKIAKENDQPGIGIKNPEQLRKLLPIFRPDWIWLSDWDFNNSNSDVEKEVSELLKKQKNLKTLLLIFSEIIPDADFKVLASIPSLKNLQVSSVVFNRLVPPTLPDNMKHLEELLITGDDEEVDISIVKELKSIKKLSFIEMKMSGNIEDLSSLSRLTRLSFTGTEVENLQDLQKMPSVTWFSFPINTSQKDFKSFITLNPQLEYCEIIGCKDITELSPLASLKKLKGLVLSRTEIEDYSVLQNLSGLEFLILPKDFFSEDYDTEREGLKNKLPDTHVVCSEPFCLGSGWILLFPGIMVLCLVFILCFKKLRINSFKRK